MARFDAADDVQRRKPFLRSRSRSSRSSVRIGPVARRLIAYYVVFSLFPLLLAFVTLSG